MTSVNQFSITQKKIHILIVLERKSISSLNLAKKVVKVWETLKGLLHSISQMVSLLIIIQILLLKEVKIQEMPYKRFVILKMIYGQDLKINSEIWTMISKVLSAKMIS